MADIGLIGELGLRAARYGIPWHRIQPRRDAWEWDFVDRAVDRLLELGIEPIIDLVHYGLPPWIENAYLHPDFANYMADYAARVAERLADEGAFRRLYQRYRSPLMPRGNSSNASALVSLNPLRLRLSLRPRKCAAKAVNWNSSCAVA